jgi:hypothetical protein
MYYTNILQLTLSVTLRSSMKNPPKQQTLTKEIKKRERKE